MSDDRPYSERPAAIPVGEVAQVAPSESAASPKKRMSALAATLMATGIAVGSVIVLVIIIGVATYAANPDRSAGPAVTSSREPSVAPPVAQEQTPAEKQDEYAKGQGFQVVESGELYIRALKTSEFDCDMYRCLVYEVHTVKGCPSNLYVEASLMSGDSVVGFANDTVGAVRPDESAFVKLQDYKDIGESFRISKVNCY